ncbi:MAG: hypothetical protein JNL39_09105 [Opitutaceae bacterium]|nr:hypothetical protein [Opitutaceae bacterium]
MNHHDEIRRLLSGPRPDELPSGRLIALHAECSVDAEQALQLVREAWATALWQPEPARLGLDQWKLILPRWLTSMFETDIVVDDPLLQRAFQLQGRMRPGGAWTLANWVRAIGPAERRWAWWSAAIAEPTVLLVRVVATTEGEQAEALQWVLRCAGARSIAVVR